MRKKKKKKKKKNKKKIKKNKTREEIDHAAWLVSYAIVEPLTKIKFTLF